MWWRDLLDPEAPSARTRTYDNMNARAEATLSQQIHRGVFSLPWVLSEMIQAATVVGATKRPRLLMRLS